jgi:SAM-dependent methyltransferase
VVLAARARALVLSPDATVEKFDLNAGGWNGEPGHPGYAHFRWMRRHVARFAHASGAQRILDFGCGAGWVGIEAALLARAASLSAFDPSPAMPPDRGRERARRASRRGRVYSARIRLSPRGVRSPSISCSPRE